MKSAIRVLILLAVLPAVLACQSGPTKTGGADGSAGNRSGRGNAAGATPTESEEDVVPPHERFLTDPTVVKARTINAILPMSYRDEVEVKGLSVGWQSKDGRDVWEGSGKAEVKIRNLVLSGPSVIVTLVRDQEKPEVLIQATGEVSFGHVSKGLSTQWEGKTFLMMRNDRWVEQ